MTISLRAGPADGLDLIRGELSKRRHPEHPLAVLRNRISVGSPLPVHHLGLKALRHEDPLSKTREIGWRYPLLGDDACGLAFLLKRSGHFEFVGTSGQRYSQSVFELAALAERELGNAVRRFHVRLLDIPSIHLYSLWFFAQHGKSQFLLLDSVESIPAFRSKSELTSLIKARMHRSS
jgi:hypothetical protein